MNKARHTIHQNMVATAGHYVGNHIPVLASHVGSPVIMSNHNFSISRVTACGNKGATITGGFIFSGTGFFFFCYLGNIIISQFFHGVKSSKIQTIIIFLLRLQAGYYAIDLIFVFTV